MINKFQMNEIQLLVAHKSIIYEIHIVSDENIMTSLSLAAKNVNNKSYIFANLSKFIRHLSECFKIYFKFHIDIFYMLCNIYMECEYLLSDFCCGVSYIL